MRTFNVGLFGLGVVGGGVVTILHKNRDLIRARLGADLRVVKAVTANPKKTRELPLDGVSVSSDPKFILDDPSIDIVVELMGGTGLAKTVVLDALSKGKAVVTANKALLAEHAKEIFAQAYKTGAPLGMEAAVAGGIPVIRSLREGLASDNILEICGIVNGTCNYILTKMSQEGAPFDRVLAEAQKLGYAEADPTFDVDGHDAAHKLAVLVNLAYGATIPFADVYREGIRSVTPLDIAYARQLGFTLKLLAIAKPADGSVEARVHPTLVENTHLLAAVSGVYNAVFLTGDNVDATLHYGRGAGALPTGGAVVSDLMDAARTLLSSGGAVPPHSRIPPLGVQAEHVRELKVRPMRDIHSEYYLRFPVLDRVGVLAKIMTIMGDHNISIKSMIQPEQALRPTDPVQVILTTHRAKEADVDASLAEIQKLAFIQGPAQRIRIERF
jgi:homoserine dehydrogenase